MIQFSSNAKIEDPGSKADAHRSFEKTTENSGENPMAFTVLSTAATDSPPTDRRSTAPPTRPGLDHKIVEALKREGIRDSTVVIIPNDKHKVPIRILMVNDEGIGTVGACPRTGEAKQGPAPHGRNAFGSLTVTQLQQHLSLSDRDTNAIGRVSAKFPMKIPQYYADLISKHEILKQIVVPSTNELIEYDDDAAMDVHADESRYQPVEGIVHRYHGKLLFFPTLKCFGHCRFCFRAGNQVTALSRRKLDTAIDYIRNRTDVREVLLTGGDPLVLSQDALDDILGRLRAIQHIEIIRIGTRALAYAPQVITPALVDMLSRHKPVFMTLSFVHPDEITPYCAQKLNMLSDAGIVMLQQGPLLKGVNDDPVVLKQLYEKLAKHRVLAYYAIYGIYAPGIRHFIVNREEARQLFVKLENETSGHCLPHLITLDQNDNKSRSVL
jgi:lysine 2,3-aminomutase